MTGKPLALVVDDEAGVRRVVHRMLKPHQFDVVEAASGADALERLATIEDTVSVVLLDWSMPGMGGRETLGAMARSHPNIPVILLSGHDQVSVPEDASCAGFVRKPFCKAQLRAAIEQALAPSTSAA